jgi:pyruvate ferredoxin oxidoreductase beta subunit
MEAGLQAKERIPVEEFLKPQGRFRHLLKGGTGQAVIEAFQKDVDEEWEYVLKRCGETWEPQA